MKIALTLGLVLLLGACAEHHQLALCNGPLVAMNTDHWQPTPQDVLAFQARIDAKK